MWWLKRLMIVMGEFWQNAKNRHHTALDDESKDGDFLLTYIHLICHTSKWRCLWESLLVIGLFFPTPLSSSFAMWPVFANRMWTEVMCATPEQKFYKPRLVLPLFSFSSSWEWRVPDGSCSFSLDPRMRRCAHLPIGAELLSSCNPQVKKQMFVVVNDCKCTCYAGKLTNMHKIPVSVSCCLHFVPFLTQHKSTCQSWKYPFPISTFWRQRSILWGITSVILE